jgi:RNA-binding protein 25
MRCIRCLNGVELPDLTPGAGSKPAKALVVKVDDKTREFLEEFEQTLGRSDVSDQAIQR